MVPLSMVIIYNGGSPITVIIISLFMMVPLLPDDTIKSIIHIISFISILLYIIHINIISFISILYHSYPYYIIHIHIISFISILYHSYPYYIIHIHIISFISILYHSYTYYVIHIHIISCIFYHINDFNCILMTISTLIMVLDNIMVCNINHGLIYYILLNMVDNLDNMCIYIYIHIYIHIYGVVPYQYQSLYINDCIPSNHGNIVWYNYMIDFLCHIFHSLGKNRASRVGLFRALLEVKRQLFWWPLEVASPKKSCSS